MEKQVQAWTAYADSYGTRLGRVIPPTDTAQYPMQILSLLSDAQEQANAGWLRTSNDMINGAKMMLDRMSEAAQLAERNQT